MKNKKSQQNLVCFQDKMAEPLNLTGFVGLDPNMTGICTIEASCVTGFEPMAQEEIQVISNSLKMLRLSIQKF